MSRTSDRYFPVRGITMSSALTSLDWMARRASGSATSLNTFARSNPYSLLSTSTILALASPPSTPTRWPFSFSMLSMDEPGGAMMSAAIWLTTTTACAFDKSPTSPRTTARSTLPSEKALAAPSAVPLSTTLSRTDALFEASRLAMADIALAASPSIEPTATLSVTPRVHYPYPTTPPPDTTPTP